MEGIRGAEALKVYECAAAQLRFREGTRLQCLYGCIHHQLNPLCPPASPEVGFFKKLAAQYQTAQVLYKIFDALPPQDLSMRRNELHAAILKREYQLKAAGNQYAVAFVSGPCSLCFHHICTLPACRRKLMGRSPVCATGIDLEHLTREVLRLPPDLCGSFWRPQLPKQSPPKDERYLGLGLILY